MTLRARAARAVRRGFTLVELLTVIAIIAILAGILLPVMATVRESARKSSCSSNIHQIIQALQMYKDDWRVYPDALFGYAPASGGACPSGLDPGQLPNARLYLPDYVKDLKVFNCPNSTIKTNNLAMTTPINRVTNQPHVIRQRGGAVTPCFYGFDSYDMQFRPSPPSGSAALPAAELHYTRYWLDDGTRRPTIGDDPRQLIFRRPSDSTVVTWCLYHSSMDSAGNPSKNTQALVGFLSGRVQSIPADKVKDWPNAQNVYPWQVQPKP